MQRALLSIALIAFVTALVHPLSLADTIYDSQGFEDPLFSTGPLNGQNGWIAYGAYSGQEPVIITAPEPVKGAQAIRLGVSDFATANSYMEISVSDILAAGYDEIIVSFDIYRQNDGFVSNLWWWWFNAGTPTYGLQWDENSGQVGGTYPFGLDGTSMATIVDRYATVEMIWNFHTGEARGYYDGNLVTNVDISGIAALTGWAFSLAHDEGTGSGADCAWLDNFKIEAFKLPELLVEPDPLVAGKVSRYTVSDAVPDRRTLLVYSLQGPGTTYVPFLNVTLDLFAPKLAASAIKASPAGEAVWILKVPTAASGRTVWLQAVQFEQKTNMVEATVL